ncbi:MAG TPA: DUF5989 family protein [Myxococcaceae bacterium]|nr:DUF5989 family protein [Myxococcaceae bacterium]
MIVFANAIPSIGEFAAGLWRSDGGKRWLIPLVVFLCVTGLLLILAATVQALAPFIYAVF